MRGSGRGSAPRTALREGLRVFEAVGSLLGVLGMLTVSATEEPGTVLGGAGGLQRGVVRSAVKGLGPALGPGSGARPGWGGAGCSVSVRTARLVPVKAGRRDAGHNLQRTMPINTAAVRRVHSDRVRFPWNRSLRKCTWPRAVASAAWLSLRVIDLGVSSLACSRSSPPPRPSAIWPVLLCVLVVPFQLLWNQTGIQGIT